MKRSIIKINVLLLSTILFSGCDERNSTIYHKVSVAQKGYLVAPMDEKIQYQCGGKTSYIKHDGMFQCPSLPVTFYVDSKPIGSVKSLHPDGYVFPQDILTKTNENQNKVKVASW
jgi:hypothetical protein